MDAYLEVNFHPIHKTTIVWIVAEIMDMITTLIGFTFFTAVEGNPIVGKIGWLSATLFKVAITLTGILFLQMDKSTILRKIDWIFPVVAIIPVAWNIFQLIKVLI